MNYLKYSLLFGIASLSGIPTSSYALDRITWRTEAIEIPVGNEKSISGALHVPSACPKGTKLPVVVVFGGFEEAERTLELLSPDEPVVLASFAYPYEGERKFKISDVIFGSGKFRRSVNGSMIAADRFISILKARPDVDVNRIAVVGASFGAPLAVHLAATSDDVSALIVLHGFGDIPGVIQNRLTQIFTSKIGFLAAPFAWIVTKFITLTVSLPKPEDEAKQLRKSQRVLMVEATEDSFVPKKSRDALWQGLSDSKAQVNRIQMPGEHMHAASDQLIKRLTEISEKWFGLAGWFSHSPHCGR